MINLKGAHNSKEMRRRDILNAPLLPLLIKMSIPTIIGMLVSVLYNLTDAFFIGMLNDKSMTAAIGIVFSFVSIVQAIGFWFGYGSGNNMSKRLGENNESEAAIISSLGLVFAIVSGIAIAILVEIFIVPVASFIGGSASKELLAFTIDYLKIIAISVPFTLYAITLYNQLRLCGNAKDGMLGLLSGMLSNIMLDPIYIFVFKTGFVGAAYATLTGHVIAVIVLTLLASKNGNISVRLNRARFNKVRIYHILAGGAPNFSRQGITSIALVLLNIRAAKYGAALIAALTVSSRIIALAIMIMVGWGQGFQPICAMNYGAKQYDRVKRGFKLTATIGTSFLIVASFILFIFAKQLVGYLSNNDDVVAIAVALLRMQCLTLPLFGFLATSSMFMQNVSQYLRALIIATSRQGTLYIPLLFILPTLFGEFGIYLLQPIADLLSFVLVIILIYRYFKGENLR